MLLASGDLDEWEDVDTVDIVDGYLTLIINEEGPRPVAVYAAGMWMKVEYTDAEQLVVPDPQG